MAPGYLAIPETVQVSALADVVPHNLNQAGNLLEVPPEQRYADYREMLKKANLDAVTIATPHALHAEQARAAAEAGVAIISEKPMGVSLQEADQILEAVDRHQVPYAVVHNFLFTPGMQMALADLGQADTGGGFYGRAKSLFNKTDDQADPHAVWRASKAAGGGAINDTAYHEIYLVEALVGSPIRYVEGRVQTKYFDFEVDDLALLLLEHENGAVSTVSTAWCVPGGGAGETANLAEVHTPAGAWRVVGRGRGLFRYVRPNREWESVPLATQPEWAQSGHAAYIEATLKALATESSLPVSGQHGRHNLAIIEAARQATVTRRAIDLTEL